ncbi:MAG: flavodoxin [Methanobacterium sp. ERen5]|nr:MAG: flavodoxin [Methanobacterium sp. ERen5]
MKTLIVYYSRTGVTKGIAEEISNSIDCDIEEIIDKENRSGIIGYIKSGYETVRNKVPEIEPPKYDLANYELLIIGTPVWAGKMAVPVKTYLEQNRDKIPNLACFCTCGGSGIDGTLNGIAESAQVTPLASFGLKAPEIKNGSYSLSIEKFIENIS